MLLLLLLTLCGSFSICFSFLLLLFLVVGHGRDNRQSLIIRGTTSSKTIYTPVVLCVVFAILLYKNIISNNVEFGKSLNSGVVVLQKKVYSKYSFLTSGW